VTLFGWECGSDLYGQQELEVNLDTTRPEYEPVKMARVNQRLRDGSALSSGQGECSCRRIESQGSLHIFASCTPY
jgi:hypothetical protein